MKKSVQVVLHIIFWILIVLWRAKADYYTKADFSYFLIQNIIRIPPIIVATYLLAYYILPKYLIKDKDYFRFILFSLINFIVVFNIELMIFRSDLMTWFIPQDSYMLKVFKYIHPFRIAFGILSVMGIFSLFRFFQIHLEAEQKRNHLEKENLQTKLDFLKTQVNPHFLFNALNNIYSMAIHKDQQEIAEGIDNLSGIMKYLTYDSNLETVPLSKEVGLLKNYIEIQHLRTAATDDVTISFNIDGNLEDKNIAPVILLPLVENGFKHGIKLNEVCLVSIKLSVHDEHLIFNMKNSLFPMENKHIEKGIGIENVRKRMDLLYPGNYELTLTQDNNYFITHLRIKLDAN